MNETKKYTAADFARYHAGAMPAAEMHALEKAALEDPFLEDALEGYSLAATPAADAAGLRERLAEAASAKKVFFLSLRSGWWRIAALLIVMAGAGYLFLRVNNNAGKQGHLAKNEKVAPVATGADAPVTAFAPQDSSAKKSSPQTNAAAATVTPANITLPPATGATAWQSNQSNAYSVTPQSQQAESAAPINGLADEGAIAQNSPAQNSQADFYRADQQKNAANNIARNDNALNNNARFNGGYNNVFNGTVKDQNGNAVANASITVADNKSKAKAVSDRQGNFKLNVAADSTVFAKAAAPGYKTQAFDMKAAAPANVTLEKANTDLDAAVVTTTASGQRKQPLNIGAASATVSAKEIAMAPAKKNADKADDEVVLNGRTSMPASGETAAEKAAFDKYINENLQPVYNQAGVRLAGEVLLSFIINKKGRPKNIKVSMSLCPPCEAQAIQLLENGPDWAGKKNEEKTVIIKF